MNPPPPLRRRGVLAIVVGSAIAWLARRPRPARAAPPPDRPRRFTGWLGH
jgi:hypothetical protein